MENGYKRLKIWLASKELVKIVYTKIRLFPKEEQFALCDQLRRAVVSIPSNIAEGYGRDTHKDFAHFLSLARGSLFEVDTQLSVAVDLGYMKPDVGLENSIEELSKMIASFRTRLLTSPTPTPHSAPHPPHPALSTPH
jgi:four helix bundle protein